MIVNKLYKHIIDWRVSNILTILGNIQYKNFTTVGNYGIKILSFFSRLVTWTSAKQIKVQIKTTIVFQHGTCWL